MPDSCSKFYSFQIYGWLTSVNYQKNQKNEAKEKQEVKNTYVAYIDNYQKTLFLHKTRLGIVAHTFNPCTQEGIVGRFIEWKASLVYIRKLHQGLHSDTLSKKEKGYKSMTRSV